MEKTIPKITPSGKEHGDKWYGEKLHNMRNKVSKLKRKYQRKPSDRNYREYLDKVNDYKKACIQTKNEDFKDFLEMMPDIQTLSNFHKNISKQKAPQINSLKKPDGTFSTPGLDTAKTLTRTHFPNQTPLMGTNYSRKEVLSSDIKNKEIDWITDDLICQAMMGFQAKNPPGLTA